MRAGLAPRNFAPGFLVVLVLAAVVTAGREGVLWLTAEVVTGQAHAIDGDSLRVDGRELRLIGIDAPEYRQTCRRAGQDEPCGLQARDRLAALLRGGGVSCSITR